MTFINTVLPFLSALISAAFAFFVLRRYAERKGEHLLF